MKYTVTGRQMKEIDRFTIEEIGIPSMVLMERAALAVVEEMEKSISREDKIVCVCGNGNNGADGVAAGRILHGKGYDALIVLAGDTLHPTGELLLQIKIAESLSIPILVDTPDLACIAESTVIVDGIFGIGLSRTVTGSYSDVIRMINENTRARVYAIDIPSGIHADTGMIMGTAVNADVTVTFGYAKTGQLCYPGKSCCGRLAVRDIGFPGVALAKAGYDTSYYEPDDRERIPGRPAYSNKGTFGRVLIAAGSEGMSGAAYLSALAAYRSGAGLVKILTVRENCRILQTQLPEAIVEMLPVDSKTDLDAFLEAQCEWATVIILGPGLGNADYAEALVSGILSHAYVPIVLDADGLNTVARYPYLTGYFTENIIITPHVGEMGRLTGRQIPEIAADILQIARDYAHLHGITCVLKDAVTVVADRDGGSYLNTSGCSAMAKGGSGDVLTGVIAGLLAVGMEEGDAACMGVYLHGLAGEAAAEKIGVHGVTATDIIACIPEQMEG